MPKTLWMDHDEWANLQMSAGIVREAAELAFNEKQLIHRCIDCAKCCYMSYDYLDVEIHPYLDNVPKELTEQRKGGPQNRENYWMKRREDGSCLALDLETKKCTIYDKRPMECRAFIVSNPLCRKLCNNK